MSECVDDLSHAALPHGTPRPLSPHPLRRRLGVRAPWCELQSDADHAHHARSLTLLAGCVHGPVGCRCLPRGGMDACTHACMHGCMLIHTPTLVLSPEPPSLPSHCSHPRITSPLSSHSLIASLHRIASLPASSPPYLTILHLASVAGRSARRRRLSIPGCLATGAHCH